jgi:hypothetical protein
MTTPTRPNDISARDGLAATPTTMTRKNGEPARFALLVVSPRSVVLRALSRRKGAPARISGIWMVSFPDGAEPKSALNGTS